MGVISLEKENTNYTPPNPILKVIQAPKCDVHGGSGGIPPREIGRNGSLKMRPAREKLFEKESRQQSSYVFDHSK